MSNRWNWIPFMRAKLKYQLVLDVEFDPQGTTPAELERNLHQVVRDSVNNGTLTGETPATVEHYDYSVKRKLNRYPKDVVIAHARKMNTKANARKLMAVDSGHYTVSKPRQWPSWVVRYWGQDPKINDCFGNSATWTGKARTKEEAVKRAERFVKQFGIWFRLHSVVHKT